MVVNDLNQPLAIELRSARSMLFARETLVGGVGGGWCPLATSRVVVVEVER
jgi:hypothetical protein